jgi:hypothetical protein
MQMSGGAWMAGRTLATSATRLESPGSSSENKRDTGLDRRALKMESATSGISAVGEAGALECAAAVFFLPAFCFDL